MSTIKLSNDNFDDFIAEPGMSIVVFSADWCQPCQDLKRVLETVLVEKSQWRLAVVDITKNTELAEAFDVRSVPWVLVVRDAVVLMAESGTLSQTAILDLMQQAEALDMEQLKQDD